MKFPRTLSPKSGLLAAMLLAATLSHAGPEGEANIAAIRSAVTRATGIVPDKIRLSSTLPGYYEVEVKGAMAYVDASGKRLIRGDVIDLATGENLTAARHADAPARIDTARLPMADAIRTVSGTGQRNVYVFVDPNCSFCKQLEPELAKLRDATVHRFVVAVLGPASQTKARQIWCSSKRELAWAEAVAGKATPSPVGTTCDDSAIARNQDLARKLGVRATPTIIFANGERVAAVMNKDQMEERMALKVSVGKNRPE